MGEVNMITRSPSGALSPYYYKGGYFHGIHYGSYFDDMDAFLLMMADEEQFILRSPEKRRLMIDLYETNITKPMYLSGAEYSVGASIGHVTYPHEGTNIDELISKADASMYIEKNMKKSKNIN
jgi:hypothetical protein